MLTRSRVIAGASGLAGEPPDEPLPGGIPHWLRFEMAADIETELLRDLNQSDQNRTMARAVVHLNAGAREFTLQSFGLENPVYIQLSRDSDSQAIPESIDISNIATLDADSRDGKRTAAFYGDKPQQGMLSFLPTGDETITVWYDRSPNTDPSADQSTFTITDSYVPLLKARLAAEMLELLGKPIGPMLVAKITRGMKQWEDFVTSNRQQGVIEKTPGLRRGRQPRSIYDAHPARINFE